LDGSTVWPAPNQGLEAQVPEPGGTACKAQGEEDWEAEMAVTGKAVARKPHSDDLCLLRQNQPQFNPSSWSTVPHDKSGRVCQKRFCIEAILLRGSWMSNGEPGRETRHEIEALLPWYAAGTLSRSDADRVERALAGDSELAQCYDRIREELVETIYLNETLGAPSELVSERLFAAIDAQETRAPRRRRQRLSRTSVTTSP
jgi:hypothetical protein